jgi:P4 family phage/plasmid primase-like protien
MQNRPNSSNILKSLRHMTEFRADDFDKAWHELNTPDGAIDLRTGQLLPHGKDAHHTKITRSGVRRAADGRADWLAFRDRISAGEPEFAPFLQIIMGAAAVGKVFMQILIIAHGSGSNGKSTFFNACAAALGDYAGGITPDVLTVSPKDHKADLATLRGRRLVIAAETEEGKRIDASMVKRIVSTDRIRAEEKYKMPFDFAPSHTLVLFTNHVPRIGDLGGSLWGRLVPVPFNAIIGADGGRVENYGDVLSQRCGDAIIEWIAEGAKRFMAAGHHFGTPDFARLDKERLVEESDWMTKFMEDKGAESEPDYETGVGDLFREYTVWAAETGGYPRNTWDFKAEMERRGYRQSRTTGGRRIWRGIRLKPAVDV